jgi:DNA-directed RNA polymerase specialized sigma24 family protein
MSKVEDANMQSLRALRLIGLALLRGMKQREQVDLMDRAGYGQNEIAALLASTPKTISVRLAEVRKARRKIGHSE